jgi:hypothetical protein
MRSKPFLALAGALVMFTLALPAWSAPQALGSEFRVDSSASQQQRNPTAAFNGAGGGLVVWEDELVGLRGRFVDAGGNAVGAELALVDSQLLPQVPGDGPVVNRFDASVAFLPTGEFVLAWTEQAGFLRTDYYWESLDVHSQDIFVQRFSADGDPVGRRYKVNDSSVGLANRAKLVVRPGGDALVVWNSDSGKAGINPGDGVFARFLSVRGRPAGAPFKVNSNDALWGAGAAVGVDSKGNFLAAWESRTSHGPSVATIAARLFDASGDPAGAEFRVDSNNDGPQRRPTVAADQGGNYLVAWQGLFHDVSHSRIFGQFVSSGGGLLGRQFQVSSGYGKAQMVPSAAAAPGGTFVVVWMDYQDWFPLGLAGVQIGAGGNPIGGEFWVNDRQVNSQLRTAMATDGAGRFLIPYEAFYRGDNLGISAKILATD